MGSITPFSSTTTTTTSPSPPHIRAILFDLDGLLLNTESIYISIIETVLTNHHLPSSSSSKIPIKLPPSLLARILGRPAPIAHDMILSWANIPSLRENPSLYHTELKALEAQHFPSAELMPGAARLLRTLSMSHAGQTREPISLHLATSSHAPAYDLKTSHLPPSHHTVFHRAFPPSRRILGDDPRIPKGKGKPAPDIYLLALANLNHQLHLAHPHRHHDDGWREGQMHREERFRPIEPAECLVVEDGVMGVEAAVRAGMQVCWVPDPEMGIRGEYAGREGDVLMGRTGEGLPVVDDDDGEVVDDDNNVVDGAGGERSTTTKRRGKGKGKGRGEDWGLVLDSLEEFPYHRYGIVVVPDSEDESRTK